MASQCVYMFGNILCSAWMGRIDGRMAVGLDHMHVESLGRAKLGCCAAGWISFRQLLGYMELFAGSGRKLQIVYCYT